MNTNQWWPQDAWRPVAGYMCQGPITLLFQEKLFSCEKCIVLLIIKEYYFYFGVFFSTEQTSLGSKRICLSLSIESNMVQDT